MFRRDVHARRFQRVLLGVIAGAVLIGYSPVEASRRKGVLDRLADSFSESRSTSVPAAGTVEVAFSPDEGSEHLVVKVIDSARSELDVLSYSFTSVPVVEALIKARHRGVVVRLVADEKDNVRSDRTGKARAALGALVNAGADVRTIGVYPIAHDKVIIADAQTVEVGSFNYSDAAAHRNSENVLVNWSNPQLAAIYLSHFQRNYRQSAAYTTAY